MKSVDDLVTDILRREGGFTQNQRDRAHYGKADPARGREWDCYCTNKGITQATLSDWLGRQATIEEVRNLDDDTAHEIFDLKFYRAPRIDTLPDEIRPLAFDCAINHGPRQAVRFVQRVVNLAGFGPVDVDGVLGPQSRKAADKANAEMGPLFNDAILEERRNFYRMIVARDPSQEVFLKGWLARADEFDRGSVA